MHSAATELASMKDRKAAMLDGKVIWQPDMEEEEEDDYTDDEMNKRSISISLLNATAGLKRTLSSVWVT